MPGVKCNVMSGSPASVSTALELGRCERGCGGGPNRACDLASHCLEKARARRVSSAPFVIDQGEHSSERRGRKRGGSGEGHTQGRAGEREVHTHTNTQVLRLARQMQRQGLVSATSGAGAGGAAAAGEAGHQLLHKALHGLPVGHHTGHHDGSKGHHAVLLLRCAVGEGRVLCLSKLLLLGSLQLSLHRWGWVGSVSEGLRVGGEAAAGRQKGSRCRGGSGSAARQSCGHRSRLPGAPTRILLQHPATQQANKSRREARWLAHSPGSAGSCCSWPAAPPPRPSWTRRRPTGSQSWTGSQHPPPQPMRSGQARGVVGAVRGGSGWQQQGGQATLAIPTLLPALSGLPNKPLPIPHTKRPPRRPQTTTLTHSPACAGRGRRARPWPAAARWWRRSPAWSLPSQC